MNTASASFSGRIPIIDISRFYAMVLVYYGHIVEQVMYLGSSHAATQYKLIYSFHMPLFFLISGTIVAEKKLSLPIWEFLKRTLAARLLPYLLFSSLLAILSVFIPGWFPLVPLADGDAYIKAAIATLFGFPAFCIPLWFLALLISVELFHYLVSKRVKNDIFLAASAILLYFGGYYLNEIYFFVGKDKVFWFLNEVPVVYCFYAAGILLRRSGWFEQGISYFWTAAGALSCLVLVVLTFDLNQGPFRIIQAVVIVLSGHGNVFFFLFTAFAGSLMVLLAAKCSPAWGWLSYMGKNSLSLLCLNGVFYHFVNPVGAKWLAGTFEITPSAVFLYSAAMTFISLILCLPAIFALTRFVPQLMGKPAQDGPVIKPLI